MKNNVTNNEKFAKVRKFSLPATITAAVIVPIIGACLLLGGLSSEATSSVVNTGSQPAVASPANNVSSAAANGAGKLISAGNQEISQSFADLNYVSGQIQSGSIDVMGGIDELGSGLEAVSVGSSVPHNMAVAAVSGNTSGDGGWNEMAGSVGDLKDGSSAYMNGATEMNQGMNASAHACDQVAAGFDTVAEGLDGLEDIGPVIY